MDAQQYNRCADRQPLDFPRLQRLRDGAPRISATGNARLTTYGTEVASTLYNYPDSSATYAYGLDSGDGAGNGRPVDFFRSRDYPYDAASPGLVTLSN